jgi:hypothetical protein
MKSESDEILKLKETVETLSTALRPFASLWASVEFMGWNLDFGPDEFAYIKFPNCPIVSVKVSDFEAAMGADASVIRDPEIIAAEADGEEVDF